MLGWVLQISQIFCSIADVRAELLVLSSLNNSFNWKSLFSAFNELIDTERKKKNVSAHKTAVGDSKTKLIRALLQGINRAFPYAECEGSET